MTATLVSAAPPAGLVADATPTRRRWILACAAAWAAAGLPSAARSSARAVAPSLAPLLAMDAAPDVDPSGFLVSEKYDGVRALWDGEQLRFRSGLPVHAPDSFTRRLPPFALDGELWLGRGRFELVSGIVRRHRPLEADWQAVRYMVFELPGAAGTFVQRSQRIEETAQALAWPALQAVKQQVVADRAELQRRLQSVLALGGEGLMLHRADAPYVGGRNAALLKLKPLHDAEAEVIGHVAGRGKHTGRLGALRVRGASGAEFLIGTGFSDAQRASPPPLGALVTYTHHGHTAAGVPRFASFLRMGSV